MLCKSCIGLTSQPKLVSREALPMAAKTFTTGLAPDGNAPLLVAGATTFPPAGGLYSSLCVERLKSALR